MYFAWAASASSSMTGFLHVDRRVLLRVETLRECPRYNDNAHAQCSIFCQDVLDEDVDDDDDGGDNDDGDDDDDAYY